MAKKRNVKAYTRIITNLTKPVSTKTVVKELTRNYLKVHRKSANADYRQAQRQVKQANKRLAELQKAKVGKTWSSSKLYTLLGTKDGDYIKRVKDKGTKKYLDKIVIPKNANKTQVTAILKATRRFLESETSTPKGFETIKQKQIQSVKKQLSTEQGRKVTDEDAELFTKMFEDKDFSNMAGKIKYEALQEEIYTAREARRTGDKRKMKKNWWLDILSNYIEFGNDEDMKQTAMNLYNKYVK